MADKKLSEEEVADLKEAFAMFDINGDGKVSLTPMTLRQQIVVLAYRCSAIHTVVSDPIGLGLGSSLGLLIQRLLRRF